MRVLHISMSGVHQHNMHLATCKSRQQLPCHPACGQRPELLGVLDPLVAPLAVLRTRDLRIRMSEVEPYTKIWAEVCLPVLRCGRSDMQRLLVFAAPILWDLASTVDASNAANNAAIT